MQAAQVAQAQAQEGAARAVSDASGASYSGYSPLVLKVRTLAAGEFTYAATPGAMEHMFRRTLGVTLTAGEGGLSLAAPGAIYHVINRGDHREDIFRDDEDRKCFLSTPGEACQKTI